MISLFLKKEMKTTDRREIWYVFSGMGSQWWGMGRGLMALDPFAQAVSRCAKALQKEGLDLMKILESDQPDIFNNILNSFVAIAAVQVIFHIKTILYFIHKIIVNGWFIFLMVSSKRTTYNKTNDISMISNRMSY